MDNDTLAGKILISTPHNGDNRFNKSVLFICTHDENGAMGLAINKPLTNLNLREFLKDLKIECEAPDQIKLPVYIGGPLEPDKGFLLHSSAHNGKDTTKVGEIFGVSNTLKSLESIATQEELPKDIIFTLGYAGWSEGQLEEELKDNAWIISEATTELVFQDDKDMMWDQSFTNLGINPALLASHVGQA